jgi:hypothetical protein
LRLSGCRRPFGFICHAVILSAAARSSKDDNRNMPLAPVDAEDIGTFQAGNGNVN